LKRRIEQIMSHRVAPRLNRARKLLLAGAGSVAILVPIGVGLFSAPRGIAQQTAESAERPSFTVASVKPSGPSNSNSHVYVRFAAGGRFSASNVTLRFLIKIAYDLRDDQILGGPNWLDSKRYDVDANCDPPFGGDPDKMNEEARREFHRQVQLRLQSMLADRFQLKISHGAKEMFLYHLVVAKNGPRLREAQGPTAGPPRIQMNSGQLVASGTNMEWLARALSEMTHHAVVDKTGLTGHYDVNVEFAPDPSMDQGAIGQGPGGPAINLAPPAGDSTQPTLLTALQEQLGLKLESHKGQADVVNIDSAQVPSEN
jgi:uncharacterized protein (TIGR03435 family)